MREGRGRGEGKGERAWVRGVSERRWGLRGSIAETEASSRGRECDEVGLLPGKGEREGERKGWWEGRKKGGRKGRTEGRKKEGREEGKDGRTEEGRE